MRDDFGSTRPALHRAAGIALLAAAGCAYPVVPTVVSNRLTPAVAPDSGAKGDAGVTVVEVRTYSISPTLSVIAWDAAEPEWGIRTVVPRNGERRPATSRLTDHRLYIATTAIVEPGGPRRASLDSHALRLDPVMRESHACDGGNCLPAATYGIAIPDTIMRSDRDSLVVKLYTRTDSELSFTLRRDLIAGYLRAVDSVTAALRSPSSQRK